MRTNRIAVLAGAALIVAACGTSLPQSTDATQPPPTDQPVTTTTVFGTTVPDVPDTTVPPTTTSTIPPTTTTTELVVEEVEVYVFLTGGPDEDTDNLDCSQVAPVERMVEPPAVLAGAMEALLAGPTDEEVAAGYYSWFSPEVGWELESAIIRDGVAYIDFAEDSPFINNASTSCGSSSFLGQLIETATQFSSVDNALFSIGGDADTFYQWLQRDTPEF